MCEEKATERRRDEATKGQLAARIAHPSVVSSLRCFVARSHLSEYACEALLLGLFMVSASIFGIVMFHPESPAVHTISSPLLRRAIMSVAMGLTGIALVYSPMGQRSGAHLNPSITLSYWRLGKVRGRDVFGFVTAQFAGAIGATMLLSVFLKKWLDDPHVLHVTTRPGAFGLVAAWMGEFVIAGLMMVMVLVVSNRAAIARWTGVISGILVATFILFEQPFSGMSMNPARTFGSAWSAQLFDGLWIYFTAPPLAMLLASEAYLRLAGRHRIYCAKMHHFNGHRCIFNCRFGEMLKGGVAATEPSRETERLDASNRQHSLHFG